MKAITIIMPAISVDEAKLAAAILKQFCKGRKCKTIQKGKCPFCYSEGQPDYIRCTISTGASPTNWDVEPLKGGGGNE